MNRSTQSSLSLDASTAIHPHMRSFERQIFYVVDLIASGQNQIAQQTLNHLLADLSSAREPSNVYCLVFARALAEHFSSDDIDKANLYLKSYEIPQIQLFNLLVNEVPLVTLVSNLAIQSLVKAIIQISHYEVVTLIDIGIGTARQVVDLLRQLAVNGVSLKHLQIIGVEPSQESLLLAKKNILELANELSYEISFHGYAKCLEDFEEKDWQLLSEQSTSPVINASFALHHIREINGGDVRTILLRRLYQLNPWFIVLSEPNTDHIEPDFRKRFYNCWLHYTTLFKMIDVLTIDQQSKDGLKVFFFGREVADVLKKDNSTRIERHEVAASWVSRLTASGFKLESPPVNDLVTSSVLTVQKQDQLYIDFAYAHVPLASLFCART